TGERAWNIRRAFNLREGATRKDDTFPERTMREPVKFGDKEYSPFTQEHLTELIDDYYQERGWNSDGTISQEKLDELGLRL
ncbi:MAG: aldehyde ferredoxin oxidoreductase, partial [Dehalococcoidia bacterium]